MSRSKQIAIGFALVVAVALFAGFQTARLWARAEVARVEAEAEAIRAQRDSILTATAIRDSVRASVERAVSGLSAETQELRLKIAAMEQARAQAQRDVWLLRTSDDTEREFRTAFPEFADAMRMTELRPTPDAPSLRYLMVPANFARSFIIYRRNSEAYEAQRDSLAKLDDLNGQIIALQDSIATLLALNEQAFRMGYDSAYAMFERRTADYISLLQKPRFQLDVPTASTVVGSAAVGALLATLLR